VTFDPRLKSRMKLLQSLYSSIKYHKPDYVMVPSADSQHFAQGMLGLIGLGKSPTKTPIEATFHNGYGPDVKKFKDLIKETIYKLSYFGCT